MMSMFSGKSKKKVKTLAIYTPTYMKILSIKGIFEVEDGRVLSMDKIIDKMADIVEDVLHEKKNKKSD